jgi:hypothetical protein
MFRGGRVDSRGTGITSGLGYNAGGRVGYNVGGVVTLQDILKQTGAPMTGSQILQYAQDKNLNLGPDFKINPYSKFIPETVEVSTGEDVVEKPFSEILRTEGFQTYEDPKGYLGAEDTQGSIGDKTTDGGRTFSSDFGTTEQVEERLKPPPTSTGDGPKIKTETEKEEPVEYTIEDYIKMLGGDKARRRDLGDMFARASASFLGTGGVREGLAEFMKSEAASGPSRREKIEQAAATLDIKDKIATKRAGEQLKQTLAGIDYKIDATLAAQKAAESLKGKSWIDSLRYVKENLYKGTTKGLDSTSVIEDTLRLKYEKPVEKFTVSSETEIPKLEVKEGFTIVTLADGSIKIYLTEGNSSEDVTDKFRI